MKERRKYVRAEVSAVVKWSKETGAREQKGEFEDTIKNIGGGGICLATDERLDVGERLSLSIELPTDETIHARGKVVWINEFEIIGAKTEKGFYVGVEFMDITEEDRDKVETFVYEYHRNIMAKER